MLSARDSMRRSRITSARWPTPVIEESSIFPVSNHIPWSFLKTQTKILRWETDHEIRCPTTVCFDVFRAVTCAAELLLRRCSLGTGPRLCHESSVARAVTVTVPSEIQTGATIEVKASTKGIWPQTYLDLDDSRRQDLIGFDTSYELTVSTDICILATIFFVPEIPLGTIAVVGTCAFAFMAKKRRQRPTSQKC